MRPLLMLPTMAWWAPSPCWQSTTYDSCEISSQTEPLLSPPTPREAGQLYQTYISMETTASASVEVLKGGRAVICNAYPPTVTCYCPPTPACFRARSVIAAFSACHFSNSRAVRHGHCAISKAVCPSSLATVQSAPSSSSVCTASVAP